MHEAILPAGIEVVATRRDLDPPLFPAEEELVRRAVASRQAEFATGRVCARAALARLGMPPRAIVAGPRGDPRWPDGIVGSITHCRGYRAAAVGRTEAFSAIGIDAEPHEPLPAGVLAAIATCEECAAAAAVFKGQGVSWDRLLFSAKESVYKALDPRVPGALGFGSGRISFEHHRYAFTMHPSADLEDTDDPVIHGRWAIDDDLIVTAVCVRRRK